MSKLSDFWNDVLLTEKPKDNYKEENIYSQENYDISNNSNEIKSSTEEMMVPIPNGIIPHGLPNPQQKQLDWFDLLRIELMKPQWCRLYFTGKTTKAGGKIFCAHINDEITELKEYIHLVDHIYQMEPNDVLHMQISSPGGYITTATQICSAMDCCRGKIITIATGICASAGSLIWSCGHECNVGPYAEFMWHMSSHGDWGCSLSIRDEANNQVSYVRDVLLKIALEKGFITEEEVTRICNDPSYCRWISSSEMQKRINEYKEKLQKENEPEEEE